MRTCHVQLIERASKDQEGLVKDLKSVGFWKGNSSKQEMEFNAVVGNPPYQVNVGKEKDNYGVLIFGKFVQLGKKINPDYISMIIPSRWFTGGRGLDDFRKEMLKDNCLCYIHDYLDSKDLFPTVDISGGINYFLWNKHNTKLCEFITESFHGIQKAEIDLSEKDILSRHLLADSIIQKVKEKSINFMEDLVSAQTPFGFITSFKGYKEPKDNTILLHTSRGVEYVERDKVSSNSDVIDQYKVTISNATAEHAGTPDKNGMYRIISNPRIMAPGEVCTQSYRFVDTFKDIDSAISCANSTSKCKITKCFCKSTPLVLRNSIFFLVSH